MGFKDFLNDLLNSKSSMDPGFLKARERAFDTKISDLSDIDADSIDNIFGAVVDMGMSSSVSSLFCFRNGKTDLYDSNGHATLNLGQKYGDVNSAVKNFIKSAERTAVSLEPVREYPFPGEGQTNIYLIGRMGVYKTTYEINRPSTQTQSDKYLNTLLRDVMTKIRVRLQRS